MFSIPMDSTLVNLEQHYSNILVGLSILAGIIGAFTALSCNARIGENSLISKNIWLSFASLSMGLGIWTMHFIGMAAMELPVQMTYNLFLTFFSIIPAIIASLLAFYFVNQPRKNMKYFIFASILMGTGISAMHYLGMFAMQLQNVKIYYELNIFILSILVSMIVSFVALFIFSNTDKYTKKIRARVGISVVLGLAVASMHYLGMFGMYFYLDNESVLKHGITGHLDTMNMIVVTAGVSISIVILITVLLITTLVDKYLGERVNYFDPLTRLPNRRMFQKILEENGTAKAVAIWHFHNIESYNQEHGYLYVDRFIRYFSSILIEHQPPMTDLYRTEGNRFTFIANDKAAEIELMSNMRQLSKLLGEEFSFEGKQIVLQGVCAFVPSEGKVERLKKIYSNGLAVLNHPATDYKMEILSYNPKFHTRNFTEEILEGLDEAMENNELFLLFQPKVHYKSRKINSVEALIRWQHGTHGFLSPAVFLPILEANDRMSDLTDFVIAQACKQLEIWKQDESMPRQIAINIPGPYLTSSRLMEVLDETTKKYNVSPCSLELEITETSFVKNITTAEKMVNIYRDAGYSVALDDFGTGVSSLSYLKKIPISTLKIDKSFIDDVPTSEKDASIIKSMIHLGKSLNMTIVVEGIETKEQAQFLIDECGAPQMQGYYFAKPLSVDELIVWCRAFQIQMKV